MSAKAARQTKTGIGIGDPLLLGGRTPNKKRPKASVTSNIANGNTQGSRTNRKLSEISPNATPFQGSARYCEAAVSNSRYASAVAAPAAMALHAAASILRFCQVQMPPQM